MRDARTVMADLASTGLSAEQIALVFELSAAVAAEARPVKDETAERRRQKDRERKSGRGIPRNSAESAEQKVSPRPPSKTPFTPPKGGEFPPQIEAQPDQPSFQQAWDAYPEPGRRRSSTKQAKPAFAAAARAAGGADRLLGAIERFADSDEARDRGGQFVKGFHSWLRNGMWEHWLDLQIAQARPAADADPWPKRLAEFDRNGFWNTTDWGPKPGKPGSLAPDLRRAA